MMNIDSMNNPRTPHPTSILYTTSSRDIASHKGTKAGKVEKGNGKNDSRATDKKRLPQDGWREGRERSLAANKRRRGNWEGRGRVIFVPLFLFPPSSAAATPEVTEYRKGPSFLDWTSRLRRMGTVQ